MAKKSVSNRQQDREHAVARDADKRAQLKALIVDETKSFEERMAARDKLNKLTPNGSAVRLRARCQMTGRPRGVYRFFGLCRNQVRKLAVEGLLPGLRKGSL